MDHTVAGRSREDRKTTRNWNVGTNGTDVVDSGNRRQDATKMKCSGCNQRFEFTQGRFVKIDKQPDGRIYDWYCRDCNDAPKRVTIDGGPPIDPQDEYEQEWIPETENPCTSE